MLKRIGKIIIFFVIGMLLLFAVQDVLTPQWSDDGSTNRVLSAFFSLEENTVDVLFLGTSHMGRGVSPMKIYEDTKICSYNLATSGQSLESSYYILREAFKTQSPEVVFLDVARVMNRVANNNNHYWRYILDRFPRDDVFLEFAKTYCETPDNDGILSVLFPIVKYHSRWNQLTIEDFAPGTAGSYYSAGQYIMSYTYPYAPTREDITEKAKQLSDKEDSEIVIKVFEEGSVYEQTIEKAVYEPELTDYCKDYVLKINELCKNNGAQLILVKVPTFLYTDMLSWSTGGEDSPWNILKSELVEEFARENGIRFIDMMYDVNIVDSGTDTHDSGHLNVNGAEKVSVFIEKILRPYHIPEKPNEQFEENLKMYNQICTVAKLQSETDFLKYINMLTDNAEKWSVLISAGDDYTNALSAEDYASMYELGLRMVSQGNFRDAYIAAIDSGKVLYEAVSLGPISYETSICDYKVKLYSDGGINFSISDIFLDGKDYAGGRGLSIVVIDNETGLIIDSVTFDTFISERTPTRNVSDTYSRLRNYEEAVCFQ